MHRLALQDEPRKNIAMSNVAALTSIFIVVGFKCGMVQSDPLN